MISRIEFVFYGEPVAQGRPRFTMRSGYARAYDPEKSRRYKDALRQEVKDRMAGRAPLEGALVLQVRIYRSIPKAFSKKKADMAERGLLRPETRPDVDNYVKGIKDALNGICWKDDSQIVAYAEPFGKYYSREPRVEVAVWRMEEEA